MSNHNSSRRKFIKTAAYTAPVIMTLKAAPSFAKGGSNVSRNMSCNVDKNQVVKCKSTGYISNMNRPHKGNAFTDLLKSILRFFGL
jgi:hypothetical protein